jgi:hypothetical protein
MTQQSENLARIPMYRHQNTGKYKYRPIALTSQMIPQSVLQMLPNNTNTFKAI